MSRFVHWPEAAEMWCCSKSAGVWGTPAVALTHPGRQPVTQLETLPIDYCALRGPDLYAILYEDRRAPCLARMMTVSYG